jgi:hypothetical protein
MLIPVNIRGGFAALVASATMLAACGSTDQRAADRPAEPSATAVDEAVTEALTSFCDARSVAECATSQSTQGDALTISAASGQEDLALGLCRTALSTLEAEVGATDRSLVAIVVTVDGTEAAVRQPPQRCVGAAPAGDTEPLGVDVDDVSVLSPPSATATTVVEEVPEENRTVVLDDQLDAFTISGTGPEVIALENAPGRPLLVRADHTGAGEFSVKFLVGSFRSTVVDHTGDYEGTKVALAPPGDDPFQTVTVQASGEWLLQLSETSESDSVPATEGSERLGVGDDLFFLTNDEPARIFFDCSQCRGGVQLSYWVRETRQIVLETEQPFSGEIELESGPGTLQVLATAAGLVPEWSVRVLR